MRDNEKELIVILKKNGVDFTSSLPCEKIKALLEMVGKEFFHVPLTREEEGVGISAGAALSGKRPAMFVQSSGMGNMINALLSLTDFYKLPLALFISRRGVYKEKIAAQLPMGKRLPGILHGAAIHSTNINTREDYRLLEKRLPDVYAENKIHAFLLSPAIWDVECDAPLGVAVGDASSACAPLSGESVSLGRSPEKAGLHKETAPIKGGKRGSPGGSKSPRPQFTRAEILEIVAPWLDAKIVVCNLGFPSKELFHIKHQPSNFYMLGSMGMATPIGLGIALTSHKEVVVIDGDGSLLMNPGSLATSAALAQQNLTILAIDNGAYGSTGDQPTLTRACVDLETVAKGFGIRDTVKVAGEKQLIDALKGPRKGPAFIHALAIPGNRDVPNIPLHHCDIRQQVQDFLKA